MADDYSTIQQHPALRVPKGWGQQEKMLVVQLEEILDDIYRRFGRLRLEDMGKAFRKQLSDDEGNIASLELTTAGLSVEVGNKISKTSTLQTADQIVTEATTQAASSASNTSIAKTRSLQTADQRVTEATTQAASSASSTYIAKTSSLQTAEQIVNSAESYTNGQLTNYSTTTQMNSAISAYVGNNAYGQVSGITITANGIEETGSKFVKLKSGDSIVLLEPAKISMSTDGVVSILGKDNSVIQLKGGTDNAQTIFKADASGVVQAKTVNTSDMTAASATVTNLRVTGNLYANMNIPNIVVSSNRPAAGNATIWLEPNTSVVTPFDYTGSLPDIAARTWDELTNLQWRKTVSLTNAIPANGAKKIKVAGNLYKNGTDTEYASTLTIVANKSDNTTVTIGNVSFPAGQSFQWNYGFSQEATVNITSNVNITGVTFTYTSDGDRNAKSSSMNTLTIEVSGETGTAGSSDECTVHFIA